MEQETKPPRVARAEQIEVTDIRRIDGTAFVDDMPTVYEVDFVNDRGETRENLTIIPGILYEATHDVRFRHEQGVVGKYTIALANADTQAKRELVAAINTRRSSFTDEIDQLVDADTEYVQVLTQL